MFDRNRDALVMQATFNSSDQITRAILGSDADWDALAKIVQTTKRHKRSERLNCIFKLPHHCSYLSIGPEKGDEKTVPDKHVKWLFETQSNDGCIIVSPSWPIPAKGSKEDKDPQPPHRQAKNYYYDDVVTAHDGEWKVTMEHPKVSAPKPIVIEISSSGAMLKKQIAVGAAAVIGTNAPRAG